MTGDKGRTALVTGGHGFLGSHLVDLLLERGDRVRCLLRPGSDPARFGGRRVEIVRGDLRRRAGLERAVAGVDVVFHVAGLIAARSPARFREVNAAGTERLARAVLEAAPGCRRFVLVSSQAAAGPSPRGRPLDKRAPPRPVTHYGRSKLAGERALRSTLPAERWTILRPPALYGPRDRALLPFFRMAARGWFPELGAVDRRRFDLLHAADAARALALAADVPAAAGRVYFLAPATGGCTYRGLRAAFEAALERRLHRVPVPDVFVRLAAVLTDEACALLGRTEIFGRQKAVELLQEAWVASPAAAARDLGWRAEIPLVRGLRATAAWYAGAGLLSAAPPSELPL